MANTSTNINRMNLTVEPGKQVVLVTREFDAPRELVFKAHIDPELYVQWLGPRGYEMQIETFEPREGGRYRYMQKDLDGNEHRFNGVYHEVTAPERIINTFEYEGLPERGHVVLDILTLEELPGGRTRITVRSVFPTVEDRDGMVQSGMEYGMKDSYDRLDELFARIKG